MLMLARGLEHTPTHTLSRLDTQNKSRRVCEEAETSLLDHIANLRGTTGKQSNSVFLYTEKEMKSYIIVCSTEE